MSVKKTSLWKYRIAMLVFAAILVFTAVRPGIIGHAEEAETVEDPVNFVLVLDRSGSLETSDPGNLYYLAAKMFVDMLPSENANLAVVGFGSNYGGEAYQFPDGVIAAGDKADQVKVFYDLQDTTSSEQKQAAKASIDDASQNTGDTSQIGYALTAATDILQQKGAADGKAAIILVTDGVVTGEKEPDSVQYQGWQFSSVNNACHAAADRGWKVYALELDAQHHDSDSGSTSNTAKALMRGRSAFANNGSGNTNLGDSIPEMTGTDPIQLNSPEDALDAFADLFSEFYGTSEESTKVDPVAIQNGSAELAFTVEDMVAETTLTITGNVQALTSIDLQAPDGTVETYQMPDPAPIDNREVAVENGAGAGYVSMKLWTPANGDWKLICHGTDGVQLGLYAVFVRDMGLQLTDNGPVQYTGITPKGTQIDFLGQFIYHGSVYQSPTVYQTYQANIELATPDGTAAELPVGAEDGYHYSLSLDKYGTYTAVLTVHDDHTNKDIKSEPLTYTVDNVPVQPQGTPEDVALAVGEAKTGVNLSGLFMSVDTDPVTYGLQAENAGADPTVAADIDPATGMANFTAGKMAGSQKFLVTASDGIQTTPTTQELTVQVVNQPLVFAGPLEDKAEDPEAFLPNAKIAIKTNKIPEFLLNIAGVEPTKDYLVNYADVFSDPDDPDGTGLQVTLDEDSLGSVLASDGSDASHLALKPLEKGYRQVTVTAVDENDPSVVKTLHVHVDVVNAAEEVWRTIRVPVIAALIALIVLIIVLRFIFSGKKIYGVYEIQTSDGIVKTGVNFSGTRTGKKSKASLAKLLKEQSINTNVGDVTLAAGLRFGQKVFLTNLGGLEKLETGREKYDAKKLKKTGKVELRKGARVTLTKGDKYITLTRRK